MNTITKDNKDTFEIGLVMAGAVSAGAYTAGVVDYLLEALQHYQKVRKQFAGQNQGQSLHNIQIRVCAGASAGGMTGTMLLSAMMDPTYKPMSGYHPNTVTPPDIAANVFYRSWVDGNKGIDISYLLDSSDITGKQPLLSLLNCKRLTEIADDVLCHPRELQARDYIPARFEHFVSVFNMGGVPYTVNFQGSESEYGMVNHADMMHFVVDRDKNASFEDNEIGLNEEVSNTLNANWKMLRQSTLATGAFPLALEPRQLAKKRDAYNKWRWWIPQADTTQGCNGDARCFSLEGIKPDWPQEEPEGQHTFVCADGGVANNEPLEIARRALAGKDLFNPRGKDKAHRAVLMVDPFPAEPFKDDFKYEGLNLFKLAARLFGSLKMQARFKPDELEVARNPEIYSRFIIAPSREGAVMGHEIASASLGAFGGFLSEKFRQHDFQLGRKNCQSFLMNHFIIGINNSLVSNHLQWYRDNGCVVRDENGDEFVQIIPMADLLGDRITAPVEPIPYDSIKMTSAEVTKLMQQIEKRIEAVVDKSYIINKTIDGVTGKIKLPVLDWLANKALKLLRGAIANYIVSASSSKIENIIREDLSHRKLL
jgi:hypothetical protein